MSWVDVYCDGSFRRLARRKAGFCLSVAAASDGRPGPWRWKSKRLCSRFVSCGPVVAALSRCGFFSDAAQLLGNLRKGRDVSRHARLVDEVNGWMGPSIKWVWQRSHDGNEHHNRADRIARAMSGVRPFGVSGRDSCEALDLCGLPGAVPGRCYVGWDD